MRNLFLTLLLGTVLSFLGAENGFTQDEELPVIQVITTSAAYEQLSENNYKLTFKWQPAIGAQRYTVRYGYEVGDADDPGAGLAETAQVLNDSTNVTIPLTSKNCFVQVVAFDSSNAPVAKSGVYTASLSLNKAELGGPAFNFIFLEAFGKSFEEMDPIAGVAIVIAIIILLLYGSYMHFMINKEVRLQDNRLNKDLDTKVNEVMAKWSTLNEEALKTKEIERRYEDRWKNRTEKQDEELRAAALAHFSREDGENLAKDVLEGYKKEELKKQIIHEVDSLDKRELKKLATDELKILKNDCKTYEGGKYSILKIFEAGLENHIANFGRDNASEEVDRDMEKAIFCEIENLKLGNNDDFGNGDDNENDDKKGKNKHKRDKHVSLNRIKMFGEVSPMLGLLGTVSGLIVAFYNILTESSGDTGGGYQDLLSELSGGIYSAIVTTIIGLIVGIILLFMHHGVEGNIRRLQNTWQNLYREISRTIS